MNYKEMKWELMWEPDELDEAIYYHAEVDGVEYYHIIFCDGSEFYTDDIAEAMGEDMSEYEYGEEE